MITPSINTALEPITVKIFQNLEDVSVHFTRIPVSDVGLDSKSASQFTLGRFENAARLLADARATMIAWNGTSGSWMGIDDERKTAELVASRVGIPFTTSTLALIDSLHELGIRRYSLAVPYPEGMAQAIARNYLQEGLTCVKIVHRGWETRDEVEATDASLMELLEEALHVDSQAVVVVCTNVATAPLIAEFEERHGIPVFDSIAATAYHCLKVCDVRSARIGGWGKLLGSL